MEQAEPVAGRIRIFTQKQGFVHSACRFSYINLKVIQAEDGIRDTMQSRGLGDVYKRQELVEEFME